jgi:hypothetical protein
MASLLDFLMPSGQSPDQIRGGGVLGNLQSPRQQSTQPQTAEIPSAQFFSPAQAPGSSPGGGAFGDVLANNPLLLMALGGGIAQGGIGRGLQAAVPAAQAEQQAHKQQQAQGVTYQALRSAGVPHGQALAGALNPEILKTIARSHFDAKPTFETIGRDEQGAPAYGFVDAARMAVTPYRPPISGPLVPDPAMEGTVRSRADSKDISSLNSLVGHIGTLIEASQKLDPADAAPLNSKAGDAPNGAVKPPHDSPSARSFALARNTFADEMAKVLRSGGMSDRDILSWKETLNASRSPAELRAVVGRSIELMSARLAALQDQHERAGGRAPPQWLPPRSRAALEKIRQWAGEHGSE